MTTSQIIGPGIDATDGPNGIEGCMQAKLRITVEWWADANGNGTYDTHGVFTTEGCGPTLPQAIVDCVDVCEKFVVSPSSVIAGVVTRLYEQDVLVPSCSLESQFADMARRITCDNREVVGSTPPDSE